ncbi:unnamed protein product [Cylicocyclus nassatus]|uniref:Uncharacterized protein n=1 Tax=Cylicocyclus nassatus TaxID=53992 RepID=A0AA36M2P1_CYLNA|nr:unnamed protein product [Cylicocyclus nassatus]
MEEDVPKLVDEGEEGELWEGEEELMVVDETGDDELQEEPEQIVHMDDQPQQEPEQMRRMNNQPQEEPEQAARLDDEPQVVHEQEDQPDNGDQYLPNMIEEAAEPIPQAHEPPGRQENHKVEQVAQELQNKRKELTETREKFEPWESTIRLLSRSIPQDLEQTPHADGPHLWLIWIYSTLQKYSSTSSIGETTVSRRAGEHLAELYTSNSENF